MGRTASFFVFSLFTLHFSLFAPSVYSQTYPACQDTQITPNSYLQCPEDYEPVCACDGKTYRNNCAAEGWGAIYPGHWEPGTCDDFDIDLYPSTITPNTYGRLSIYKRSPGTVTVLIYSSYGRLMFEKLFTTNASNDKILSANPYYLFEPQTYPTGVYIIVATVGGLEKKRKFIAIQR